MPGLWKVVWLGGPFDHTVSEIWDPMGSHIERPYYTPVRQIRKWALYRWQLLNEPHRVAVAKFMRIKK